MIDVPEICMRFPSASPIFSKVQFLDAIKSVFAQHQVDAASFIAHSFGTFWLAWLVNDAPELVDGAYFSDPVCFLLSEADVCFNFLYRHPNNFFQWVVWYYAGRETGIATVLCRHFNWYDNVLFADKLPFKARVWIGGGDEVIHPPLLSAYLDKHHVDYKWRSGQHHGGIIWDSLAWYDVLDWIAMPSLRRSRRRTGSNRCQASPGSIRHL